MIAKKLLKIHIYIYVLVPTTVFAANKQLSSNANIQAATQATTPANSQAAMTATSQAANLQAVRAALAANSAANLFTSGSPAAVITALAQEYFAMLCFN